MSETVLETAPLGNPPWPTIDPFLFCVHHDDAYPAGNDALGPAASLAGRTLGNDFAGTDGWRMYHGRTVPGFPQHPHRGFETVTIARRGYIDHSDSLGAAARFGQGDVQWMTAGRGVVHSEMFPLVRRDGPNPAELFQIWLNLPQAKKMADPHFAMLWHEDIPVVTTVDPVTGARAEIAIVAGRVGEHVPPSPPPDSWAADPANDVAIWTIRLEPGASWTMPTAHAPDTIRAAYVFTADAVRFDDDVVTGGTLAIVRSDREVVLRAGESPTAPTEPTLARRRGDTEILVLQGRPISEPVAQYGPFVMNDRAGVQQAFEDYQRTGFGGWPWPADDPVHPREEGRFARHADGRIERPTPAPATVRTS